jgi:hypothetical protein
MPLVGGRPARSVSGSTEPSGRSLSHAKASPTPPRSARPSLGNSVLPPSKPSLR